MLKRLRRGLRRLNYHAASKERTAWTRAQDAALFLSLGLAIPATWICDREIERIDTVHSISGAIAVREGGYAAQVSAPEQRIDIVGEENFWGFFRADVDRMKRGFPVTTSQVTRQPVIALTPRQDRPEFRDSRPDLAPGSPMHSAIRAATEASDRPAARMVAEYFAQSGPVIEQNWGAWGAGILLLWVSLFVILSILLLVARITTVGFLRQRAVKEATLSAQGKCPFCGYDLRGLEFSPRCPECGELQQ